MPYITTQGGIELYYTDQGEGSAVILSHGWSGSSDAWEVEVNLLADSGYRAIAHDRRGHGRSSTTDVGTDMDTYSRDLADLVEQLDLIDLVLVGHSTGGAEVVRYAARYAHGRVKKLFTAGSVPFSAAEFTDDLAALTVPIFLAQGDGDQIVPAAAAAEICITLVAHGTLKLYPGASHEIVGDYRAALGEDILGFLAE